MRLNALFALGGSKAIPRSATSCFLCSSDRSCISPRTVDGGIKNRHVVTGHALRQYTTLAIRDRAAHRCKERATVEPAVRQCALLTSHDHGETEEPRCHATEYHREDNANDKHPPLKHGGAAK